MSITGNSNNIFVNDANLKIAGTNKGLIFSDGTIAYTAPFGSDNSNTIYFGNAINAFVITETTANTGFAGNTAPTDAISVSSNLFISYTGNLITYGKITAGSVANVESTILTLESDLSDNSSRIDSELSNIVTLQTKTTDISYDAPTTTTAIANDLAVGADLEITRRSIIHTDNNNENLSISSSNGIQLTSYNDENGSRFGLYDDNAYLDADNIYFRKDEGTPNYGVFSDGNLQLFSNGNEGGQIRFYDSQSTANYWTIDNDADSALRAFRNVGAAVTLGYEILANGNMGVGTNIPEARLEVAGTFDFDTGTNRIHGKNDDRIRHYSDYHLFYNYAETEMMRLDTTTGRLGIGQDSPAYKLDILTSAADASAFAFRINGTNTTNGNIIETTMNPGYITNKVTWQIENQAQYHLFDSASGVERMRVNHDGNVGIGTASPAYKLEVAGDVYATAFKGVSPYIQSTSGHYLLLSAGDSSTYSDSNKFYIRKSGVGLTATFDNDNGTVMIGAGSALSAKLQVNGVSGTIVSGSRRYFNHSSQNVTTGPDTSIQTNNSIAATGSIVTNGYFVSTNGTINSSDERIKSNIQDINDTVALDQLRLLQPKTYQYKDVRSQGVEPVIGFIAQEVKEVISKAVEIRTDVIPNIYELANVSQSNVITFTNFNTSELAANCNIIRLKTIQDDDATVTLSNVIDEHTIQVVEDLSKFTGSVDENGNVITETVTTTYTQEEYDGLESKDGINVTYTPEITEEEYKALTDEEKEAYALTYSKTETVNVGDQIFVYGQEVDDFNFLKKDSIFTIATAALQEVDRQQQADKERIATLESQLAALLSRVEALENTSP
jgi:hypothetical protein